MAQHIFRNATRTLPLIFTLNASEALLTLAGLGFLGFGIEPTAAAEWGFDLNRALSDATSGIWWTGVFPGAAIVLTVPGPDPGGRIHERFGGPALADAPQSQDVAAERPQHERAPQDRSIGRADGTVLDIEDLEVTFTTDAGEVPAVRGVGFQVAAGRGRRGGRASPAPASR